MTITNLKNELGDAEVSIGELQAELTGAWEEAMLNVTRARQEVREELQTSVDHVQKALGQASTDQNGAHSGRKKDARPLCAAA